ncbi:hypothetical protein EB796_001470 [Bugula neritina]|uniref:Uncharacterized protein n=1 Tax=Bugula neritina TaxID=10212 RepID=A0A7J7KPZ6_BUGNE|nr:hypothetical protein EB796_001470 [Bugula neritina]
MVQSRYQPYSVIRAINTKTNIATESRRLVRPPVTSQVALPPLTRHKNSNTQMSTVAMPNYRFSHSFSHSQPSSAHPKLKTPTRNNIFTFDSLFSSPKTLHRQSSAEVLNLLSLSKEQNISTLSSPLMDALASPFTFTITNQDTTPVSTIQNIVANPIEKHPSSVTYSNFSSTLPTLASVLESSTTSKTSKEFDPLLAASADRTLLASRFSVSFRSISTL